MRVASYRVPMLGVEPRLRFRFSFSNMRRVWPLGYSYSNPKMRKID